MDVRTASGIELLVGGVVTTPGGAPVPNALIATCGDRVRTDAGGSFEVLLTDAPGRIAVLVSAPGHRPLSVELDLAVERTARLTDGTVVVLHDIVLSPERAR